MNESKNALQDNINYKYLIGKDIETFSQLVIENPAWVDQDFCNYVYSMSDNNSNAIIINERRLVMLLRSEIRLALHRNTEYNKKFLRVCYSVFNLPTKGLLDVLTSTSCISCFDLKYLLIFYTARELRLPFTLNKKDYGNILWFGTGFRLFEDSIGDVPWINRFIFKLKEIRKHGQEIYQGWRNEIYYPIKNDLASDAEIYCDFCNTYLDKLLVNIGGMRYEQALANLELLNKIVANVTTGGRGKLDRAEREIFFLIGTFTQGQLIRFILFSNLAKVDSNE